MRHLLKRHPDSRCTAVRHIEVEVARENPGLLNLRYRIGGAIADLQLPLLAAPERADGLWQHTCFEAFLQAPPSAAYCEFNFAPSTQWAAYRFTGYRDGMAAAMEIGTPRLAAMQDAEHLELQVSLDLSPVALLPSQAPWRLGLSAVIEETDGQKSYWALAHPPGRADFHNSECFALNLAAVP